MTRSTYQKSFLKIVRDMLGSRKPKYYVSDSAPVIKSAVRRFVQSNGNENWFPCSVHFCQLEMREAVTSFPSGRSDLDGNQISEIEWDELLEDEVLSRASSTAVASELERTVTSCRAIRAALKRSNKFMLYFRAVQSELDVSCCIEAIARTRLISLLQCLNLY